MRRVVLILMLLLAAPLANVDARSVHATHVVDMFPQGDMIDDTDWEIKKHLTFTSEDLPEDAVHSSGMIADEHMSLGIDLPQHLDTQKFWASSTSTDSNATMGSPDGAYSWSTGPDITMGGFQVAGYSENDIQSVELIIHFDVPHALQQDNVRFSTINGGIHQLVKTWSNTQNGLFYMNNGWTIEITDDDGWTWSELENLEVNLDYVSVGGTDDSELQADAVGLKITMQTPWYGGERVVAMSSHPVDSWPIIDLNLSSGQMDSVSIAPCGLESTSGTWTADAIEKPAGQSWGRVHVDSESGSVGIEYLDNQGAWVSMNEGLIPIVSGDLELRFTILDSCLVRAWVDINDPTIRIQGDVQGDVDAMTANITRWTLVVNGETVTNQPLAETGSFDLQIPIGAQLDPSATSLDIAIKAWFSWDSSGIPASVGLTVDSVEVSGAYSIEYDENPQCDLIGNQYLSEDGGGLILPLLTRCSDDRTSTEDLNVVFQNSDSSVIEVDLTQGQIRLKLIPESSGTSQITVTVSDVAGNSWSETFTVDVALVDDRPVLAEFPSVVPVDLSSTTSVPFTLNDIDSEESELSITTNRSWAVANLSERLILIDAPTPGFTSVLVTACDSSGCVERIIDLEVRALPDLSIEELRLNKENVRADDIVEIKVMVRNSGQVSATMIGVRCLVDGATIGTGTIPVLQPGELGTITCDWQVPQNDNSALVEVVVDRGTEIDETNEENNAAELIIGIAPAEDGTPSDDTGSSQGETGISQTTIWIGTAGALLLMLALFGLLAPSKIRKIE
ncbi:MAG: CARDB domain-containing protein [Candidatus Poseidoniaceae archaeon]|nr:CARDB domain-containing protein [Candidatus Poseidoniaceae archaeon]